MLQPLKYINLLYFFFVFISSTDASTANYQFRTFSPEGGFYYDGITSILQDKEGFIWILMNNDLFRFNGYEYKRFYPYFKNIDPTHKKQFNCMTTDSAGQLFIGTSNGLFNYNRATDSFCKLLKENISFLKTDARNELWLVQSNKFGKYKNNLLQVATCNKTEINDVNALEDDQSGFFISSADNRIYRYNYESQTFHLFYQFPDSYQIQTIKIHRNKLWVLIAGKGLIKIDIPTANIEDRFDLFSETDKDSALIRTILIDKNELIWIATLNGIYIVDPHTKKYTHYQHSKTDPYSLPNNSVWTITEDRQRNIWIGTFSGGLCYVNLNKRDRFKTYTSTNIPLNASMISGFAESHDFIWLATEGGGLNRMNKKTGEFTGYMSYPKISNSLSSNNIKSIVLDAKENLWISTFRGGLDYLDTKSGLFRHFKYNAKDINSLRNNNLRKIEAEGDSGLWIAYQENRLILSYYSFKQNKFEHYPFGNPNKHHFIFDLYKGNNNALWIAAHDKLYRMNTTTKKITAIAPPDSFYLGALTICMDGNDNLWIGTIGQGVIRYNTKTGIYTKFGEILKYNVTAICSICTDDGNNIWMGTDNGLFCFNTATEKLQRFGKHDGLQGDVFYPLASLRSKNGNLYFGGTNGFSIVNPKEIILNTFKPRVIISDFYIDNIATIPSSKNKDTHPAFTFPKEIILKHTQSNFGFGFSSDNYLIPEKTRFKYRLKGYDERWIEVNASNRTVFYTKVPVGSYTFEILAANNDGEWSDTPAIVHIQRLPSPWLSWYAYLVYFVLLVAALLLIIRHFIQQKKMKLQLYLDKLDKENKEEVYQTQLRFFTNISHDFRTPLSLMLAALEKLRMEGLKEHYYRILHGNSQRLLNLVNELMDFRTIQNEKMPLHVESTDINHLLKQLAFDFNDYARQRKIDFKVTTDETLPKELYIDRKILEKIILNLINNAFKYNHNGGFVHVETYFDVNAFISKHPYSYTIQGKETPSKQFIIAVRDSGIGISRDSIASVFERFYKVQTVNFDSHLGTGIGLALVKSLVLLHKGIISVYSEREKGTDMVIRLSLTPDVYRNDEFLKKKNLMLEKEEIGDGDKKMSGRKDSQTSTQKEIDNNTAKSNLKHILIVEDNEDLRHLISDFLSAYYKITEASNGLIASNLLQDLQIDLIISDIMMPEKDGIEFCKEMKNDINYSHIPFILLTAKAGVDSKIEGADSGADIYFEKPVDFRLLLLSIQNVFKRQNQLKEYYAKNYYADTAELAANKHDKKFLTQLVGILDRNLDQSYMDVNYIASEMFMSRSKLYSKIKSLTNKSIIEFMTSYRLRVAARLIVEEDISVGEAMNKVGIESQSYFTRAFKKEFGDTPTSFIAKHKKK